MATKTDPAVDEIVAHMRSLGSEDNRQGMARFGIAVDRAFGVPMAETRPYARKIGRDQARAEALWETGFHEVRILAALTAEPKKIDRGVVDRWVADIDSWDLCDQACSHVFERVPYSGDLIDAWTADEREFVKRAGFATIAWAAVHDKKSGDEPFLAYLRLIEDKAGDPRNFVKKAVNWALRQIGKRSLSLHGPALAVARRLAASEDKAERWVGWGAVKELEKDDVMARLQDKARKAATKR